MQKLNSKIQNENSSIKKTKVFSTTIDYLLPSTNFSSGLTFIELIVVIAIIGIIGGVIAFRYSDFSTGISLQNTAQEIALTVEQAQRYAISGAAGVGSFNSRPTYGVYFNLDATSIPALDDGSHDKEFVIFKDSGDLQTQDYFFDGLPCGQQSGSECLDRITIQTGDRITDICANEKTDPQNATCGVPMPVNITFQRPFPQALIVLGDGSKPGDVEIKLISPKLVTRTVVVWATGQISVE